MAATQRMNIDILARDKTAKAVNSSRKGFDGLKRSLFNVKTAMAGIGFGLLARNLINTGKSIESLQVRLKFLFGSAEEGARAFDKMAEFASKVPFSLEQIQQGAGNLAVVTNNADELAHIMEITGNVAAATGLDFRTTAEQVQRSLSAGISAADLFRDRGVKAMLGFKAGATVSIEETRKAFDRVFGEGGQYGKTTEELAKTFEGTLSMIGDKVFNFKRVLLDAGLFPELKRQFGDLNNFLADNGEQVDEIARKIGETLGKAVAGTGDAVKFLHQHSDALLLTLKALVVLKISSMFYNMATAIGAASLAMGKLNALTKKNIILLTATGVIVFWDKLKGKIQETFGVFKDEIEELEEIAPKAETVLPPLTGEKEVKKVKDITEATTDLKKITDKLLTTEEKALQVRDESLKLLTENAAFQSLSFAEQVKWIGRVTDEYEEAIKATDELTEAEERARDIGKELGLTFTSAFEDAVVEGKKFRDILQGIYKDLLRIMLRKTITEPVGTFLSDTLSAGVGALFPGKQFGGSVAGGKPHIVGEAGPELFVPGSSGSVVPNHQLGGGTNVVQNINVSTGVQQTVRAEIIQLMPMIKKASVEAVLEERSRGGQMAQAMGAVSQNS